MTRLTLVLALIAGLGACGDDACEPLQALGIDSDQCPDGELKLGLQVSVEDLQRGTIGTLTVNPEVLWLAQATDPLTRAYTGELTATAEVEGHDGDSVLTALELVPGTAGTRVGRLAFPDVPDGDHTLLVHVDAGFDTATIRVPVSFYTPALVHVLTDRPLYRPGEDVMLRSLVVARADRTPLGKRPGRWRVTAPDGMVLLDEPAKAGTWGVAASSVPLDTSAVHGTYTATYTSGADTDQVQFEVRPFELPRTTMEAESTAPWFESGDRIVVTASARYRSGAPIANAPVKARLQRIEGDWPAPLAWSKVIEATTDADGRVRIDWGAVPNDLRGRSRFRAALDVVEEGGERTAATATVVLSEDRIQVHAMTELDDALAGGRNNRAYLRVLTPAGRPLPGAQITVRNPWNPTAPAKKAKADEDGVIAIQLDPGDPVTLVTEPMPVRELPPPPPTEVNAPTVTSVTEVSDGRSLTLQEQRALPEMVAAARACQEIEVGDSWVSLVLRVAPGGRVRSVHPIDSSSTGRCVSRRLSGVRFPTGIERTFHAKLRLPDSYRPSLDWSNSPKALIGDGSEVLTALKASAPRRCMEPGQHHDAEIAVHWTTKKKSKRIEMQVASVGAELDGTTLACLTRSLVGSTLDEPAEQDGVGVALGEVQVPTIPGAPVPRPKPQATTSTGFELTVSAVGAGGVLGQTQVRFREGQMPALRLRASPPVITAGESVTLEFLRSGDTDITLPEEFTLTQDGKVVVRTKLDGNKATFVIAKETDGFLRAKFHGVEALVFVRRADQLTLTMKTDHDTYRPGDTAMLTLNTQAGGTGRAAAVGLVGVDASLGQLRPLPGPDAYGRVMVLAESDRPAFGSFDAHSLLLGRIRGENAAQAAVQRISKIPTDRFTVPKVRGSASFRPPQETTLSDSFARALGETATRVRAWERAAPEGEVMDNTRMAATWADALAALRAGGHPAIDAYGRELTLRRLPAALLAQLDPRQLVGDGTRLPEDTVGWVRWVGEEVKDG